MSSTGRAGVRRKDDFYATPAWVVHGLLGVIPPPAGVFDPCAGEGAILRVVEQAVGCPVHGFEIDVNRASKAGVQWFDALKPGTWGLGGTGEWVITNPPYSLAIEFVTRSIAESKNVAMLLRLNWLESKARSAFHREYPADIYVLPRRPSFTGKGTDSIAYAWFVWGRGRGNRWWLLD